MSKELIQEYVPLVKREAPFLIIGALLGLILSITAGPPLETAWNHAQGKYIQVDLTTQRVYLLQNPSKVNFSGTQAQEKIFHHKQTNSTFRIKHTPIMDKFKMWKDGENQGEAFIRVFAADQSTSCWLTTRNPTVDRVRGDPSVSVAQLTGEAPTKTALNIRLWNIGEIPARRFDIGFNTSSTVYDFSKDADYYRGLETFKLEDDLLDKNDGLAAEIYFKDSFNYSIKFNSHEERTKRSDFTSVIIPNCTYSDYKW